MAAVKRIDPRQYFSPDEWSSLARRSPIRGLALLVHCWATIVAAAAVFVMWPNPVTLILAVAVIGARQLGLAILLHDAAHAALHPNQNVNDGVARWLCGAPVGADLDRYRPYHLSHHRFVQQPEDPDLPLSRPFPISGSSLRRKIFRDLTGRTFIKQRLQPTFSLGLAVARGQRAPRAAWDVLRAVWGRFLIANAVIAAVMAACGALWAYPLVWLLPMATWYPLVTRLRNIAEHACVPCNEDPLRHARTTRVNALERLLIAPYYVNYHCEHHLFMHLPCWSLPRAHALLAQKGVAASMEVRSGYLEVIRLAASARPRPPGGGGEADPAGGRAPEFAAPFG